MVVSTPSTINSPKARANRASASVMRALEGDNRIRFQSAGAFSDGIERGLNELQAARAGNDGARIKQAIKALDQATQTFAQRRMDENIRKALAGHKLDEFDVSREKSPS